MVYEVVHCAECGKPIKAVPAWLGDVKVNFSCEACRQKHPRAFPAPEVPSPIRSSQEDGDEVERGSLLVGVDDDAVAEDIPDDFPEDEAVTEEVAVE